MKNKKTLLIFALAFVLLIGGAYALYSYLGKDMAPDQLATQNETSQTSGTESSDPEKVKVPDFTVYDQEGNQVKLSDFYGKPIVLNFWSSNCGPCRIEMPHFNEKYDELGEEIHFLMVNVTDGSWDTKETASAFIEDEGYTFPVYYDTDSSASTNYRIYSLPTTYFIDAEGYGIAQASGAISKEILEKGISMILPEA